VSTSWLDPLPKSMRKQLDEGKQEQFDRDMRIGERFSRSSTALLTFRGEPYGLHDDSRYRLYQTVMQYRLGDEVANIDTPLLITDPEGEQFWPGQSQQLFERLRGPKELVRFTAAEGGGRHCEPLAPALRDARVFDWLDRHLARSS